MIPPWSRAGKIVFVEEVTASDRPRLDPVRPDGGMVAVTLLLATVYAWLSAAIPDRAIAHGLYPLTGPGRRPHRQRRRQGRRGRRPQG